MGDPAWTDHDNLILNIVAWVLAAITLFAICTRLYVRVHCRGSLLSFRSWHWSDIFLVLAWLGYLSSCFLGIIAYAHFGFVSTRWEDVYPEPRYFIVRKMQFAGNVTFWLWLFLVKASLLCFFNELVDRKVLPRTWICIRVAGLIVGLGFVAILVYSITWCQPISRQWGRGEEMCWFEFDARFRFSTFRQILHAATDVMIFLLPLPLLPRLQNITIRQRIGAGIMLLLGLFCTLCAIVFAVGTVKGWDNGDNNPTKAGTQFLMVEQTVEITAGILIQCIPAMRIFIPLYQRRRRGLIEMGDQHVEEKDIEQQQPGRISGEENRVLAQDPDSLERDRPLDKETSKSLEALPSKDSSL